MLTLLLVVMPEASAHGDSFELVRLTARPDAPAELWGMVEGWGLVHSEDGGAAWSWLCEEAVGSTALYDVLAWEAGSALVGTAEGLSLVDESCTGQSVASLPEGFVLSLARYGETALVGIIGTESGGVYRCDDTGCAATSLVGAGVFPKSLVVDGNTAWATVVHTGEDEGLAAELWRSDDGADFVVAYAWPDGDVDPRVIHADGERVYAWLRPRQDDREPGFVRSTDGGASFSTTFETGYYTDPAPGVLVRDGGETVLLGSWFGARTWRSTDAGLSFEEVSLDAPALRCGLDLPDRSLICADHLVDGFDVAATTDGMEFSAELCLEEVGPADCVAETCEPYVDAWRGAAALGGGKCDPAADTGTPDDPPPCGCASSEGGLPLLALGAAVLLRARRGPPRG